MAKERKKLYRFVEVNDDTPVQKLRLVDQFRVLLKQLTTDPANELRNEDYATQQLLTLKANLSELIYRSTSPIRNGYSKNVVITVDNNFRPVLYEVLNSPEVTDYYNVEVAEPKIDYDIPYNVLVKLTVKEV